MILQSYGTTVVYEVRRWQKSRYAAHTCIAYSSLYLLHYSNANLKYDFNNVEWFRHILIMYVCMYVRFWRL